MINKESVLSLLGDRPVAYHPILAKVLGGVEVAIFVSQLLYWTGRSKLPGGWIFKTQAEFEEETGLTRRNQETARRKLKGLGVLNEELRGVPATMHYRLNLDKLAQLLNDDQQTSMAECAKLDSTDAPNSDGGTSQTPESIIDYTETHHEADEKWAEIQNLYQNNITIGVAPITVQEMQQPEYFDLPLNWWEEAIKIAADNGKRSWSYIRGILDRSIEAGLSPKDRTESKRASPPGGNGAAQTVTRNPDGSYNV